MNTSQSTIIETDGLSKIYKGVQALKPLNLKVREHSICGFLGPNGAGKSTTIKLLLGLSRPTGGSASVFGLDISRDSAAIRQRVGYLAQDPRYYDHMTARQTLRFTARFFYTGPKAALEDRVAETLALVGLSDKADRPIKGFSGGERQRLGIAQAQVNYPDLLILDEPAAALDPMGRRDVLDVMERLRKHTTIFYSTHILEDVQRVSDTVVILNHGELIAQAPVEQLLVGTGETVFSLSFKGDADLVRTRMGKQPWIKSVTAGSQNGATTLHIGVSDEQAAEAQLLRLVMVDDQVTVTEFGRQKHNLEEIFLNLVQGEPTHDKRN